MVNICIEIDATDHVIKDLASIFTSPPPPTPPQLLHHLNSLSASLLHGAVQNCASYYSAKAKKLHQLQSLSASSSSPPSSSLSSLSSSYHHHHHHVWPPTRSYSFSWQYSYFYFYQVCFFFSLSSRWDFFFHHRHKNPNAVPLWCTILTNSGHSDFKFVN